MNRYPSPRELKECISPVVFYRTELSRFEPRRLHGWLCGGLCPFHADRHTGNFRVNLDSGAFRCFACGAKGADVISFVQQRYRMSFSEAFSYLADRWGDF